MSYLALSILSYILFFVSSSLAAISPRNIFILAGQSNMGGRGGCHLKTPNSKDSVWDGYIPPECQSNPSVLRLNPNNQWEVAIEPLHQGIDNNSAVGIGPGMAFANQLLTEAGMRAGVVGLVPCAHGGSYINSWMKGTPFYQSLINRTKESHNQGGTVRALFWYHGESDASKNETAKEYKNKIIKFFTDVRDEVKPIFLPIILVKIASFDSFTNSNSSSIIVREAEDTVHLELPDVQIMDALELVKPNGEGFNSDHQHLNLNSQIKLGKWLADTYLSYYGNFL